ncbi:759_t:CDS:1 [Ambispora leptoticha]|uniref:759_t:CDS:1 n=1 Tax=Ambispora leptoticha TaxID=144679 RepID=A0A9N9HH56_9GLOM|nr:759_t:CDS:1 [Ambispora leptoticha]
MSLKMSSKYAIRRRYALEEIIQELCDSLTSQKESPSARFQTTLAFTEIFMLTQPPPSPSPSLPTTATKVLRIAVLDSSFNPPTNAHLQLLLKSVDTRNLHLDSELTSSSGSSNSANDNEKNEFPFLFDACLLLYSIENANKNKTSSHGEANPVDRVLMMESLAYEIHDKYSKETTHPAIAHALKNIATGIASAPRFVDKPDAISHSLSSYYSSRNQPQLSSSLSAQSSLPPLTLYFIMGYDTLTRLFDPSYYTDMRKELSSFFATNYVIYANRAGFEPQEVQQFFKTNEAFQSFRHKILRVESEESVTALSSTRVRRLLSGSKQDEGNQSDVNLEVKRLLYEYCPASVADYVLRENLYRQKLL